MHGYSAAEQLSRRIGAPAAGPRMINRSSVLSETSVSSPSPGPRSLERIAHDIQMRDSRPGDDHSARSGLRRFLGEGNARRGRPVCVFPAQLLHPSRARRAGILPPFLLAKVESQEIERLAEVNHRRVVVELKQEVGGQLLRGRASARHPRGAA